MLFRSANLEESEQEITTEKEIEEELHPKIEIIGWKSMKIYIFEKSRLDYPGLNVDWKEIYANT